jgi:hypothetical protein
MDVLTVVAVILAVSAIGYLTLGESGLFGVKYNAQQIAQFASNAGFSGQDLTTAVAIALAESGGNPKAHGDTNIGSGTGSFGLWQINADSHPQFAPNFTVLYDPTVNANAAFQTYANAGNSFSPWSTYNDGRYSAFMDEAAQAVGS